MECGVPRPRAASLRGLDNVALSLSRDSITSACVSTTSSSSMNEFGDDAKVIGPSEEPSSPQSPDNMTASGSQTSSTFPQLLKKPERRMIADRALHDERHDGEDSLRNDKELRLRRENPASSQSENSSRKVEFTKNTPGTCSSAAISIAQRAEEVFQSVVQSVLQSTQDRLVAHDEVSVTSGSIDCAHDGSHDGTDPREGKSTIGDTIKPFGDRNAATVREIKMFDDDGEENSTTVAESKKVQTSELLRLEGRECEKNNDIMLARELYRRCTELDPANGKGWQDLAKAEGRLSGGYRRSTEILRNALKLNPSNPYLWQSLGFLEFRLGRYESARIAFRAGLEWDPKHSPIYSTWGRMEGILGSVAKARDLFEEGAAADPTDVRLYYTWATMESKLGNKGRAHELYKLGLEYDPENVHIWQSLGTMAADAGDIDHARVCYKRALVADENSVAVLDHWGRLESRLGNYQIATDLFSKGMRGNPGDARILHSWSVMEFQRKEFDQAKELIRRAVSVSTRDSILWTQFGKTEAALGNIPRARALLKRAIDLNPRDWYAHLTPLSFSHVLTIAATTDFTD